ncbi:dienelactone hydrolase endo-1,3,1,4-beta-D-glucanase [Auriscalpium vulgare]|uniref:Dienelactone hydrolase endo-1,3,1,4-beta-D-glucanase n=1 Tax=Auriscalpium vulgare TaxID=40419 RepID=A0ACB8SBI0_9AGAM|nr:dienelactone hydrolase endo-1,3,1,4-beta-D-glucanase [Auriscalpium vulgare]
MSFCDNCFKGVLHEGNTEGAWETINGIEAYVGTPTVEYPKDKAIIFLTDVFGIQLINNKLLVDGLAQNGFKVYAPDLFEGDPIPENRLTPDGKPFDMAKWRSAHGFDVTRPRVQALLDGLKEQGVVTYGATGYCYGARLTFDFAFENAIAASVVAHPSALELGDLDKYATTSKAPLLINSCEVDKAFPPDKQAKADAVLGEGKFAPGYRREHFEGCEHGFAVRGDLSNPVIRKAKEAAFKNTVEWFLKHL